MWVYHGLPEIPGRAPVPWSCCYSCGSSCVQFRLSKRTCLLCLVGFVNYMNTHSSTRWHCKSLLACIVRLKLRTRFQMRHWAFTKPSAIAPSFPHPTVPKSLQSFGDGGHGQVQVKCNEGAGPKKRGGRPMQKKGR